ncbi:MAG: calcium-binding protein, partial [Oscillospiraceae bacterium]|nr:calcium-binding protein [Oscillospiraceae bacterium]
MENGENVTESTVDPNVIGKTTDEYIDSKIEDAKDNIKGSAEDQVKEMILDKLDEKAESLGYGKDQESVAILLLTDGASDGIIKTTPADSEKLDGLLPSDIAEKYNQGKELIDNIKKGREIYGHLVDLQNSINEDGTTSADYEENLLVMLDDFVGVAGSLADKIPGGKYYAESFDFTLMALDNVCKSVSEEHLRTMHFTLIGDNWGTDIETGIDNICEGKWEEGLSVYETAAYIEKLKGNVGENYEAINELNKYLSWRIEYEFVKELEAQGLTLETYNDAIEKAKKAAEREEKSKTVIGQMQLDVEDGITSTALKIYTSEAWLKCMLAADKIRNGVDDFTRNMFNAFELYKICLDYKWDKAKDKLLNFGIEAEAKALLFMIDSWTHAINAVRRIINYDPLILDLDGNGFEINSKSSGTYFDLNSDGFAEKINWTSKDAILAVDLNEDGKINNGREVFGDFHLLSDGTRASNGFEALAQYDTNKDGIIDENDEIFGKLRLWVDSDSDGKSAAGELKTLAEMNISAIRLDYKELNEQTDSEAVIGNAATFIYKDNTQGNIVEMWVSSDLIDTQAAADIELSDEIKSMLDVAGHGKLYSLHEAIALDTTGTLKNMVDQFESQTQSGKKRGIVENILAYMCNCDEIPDRSRGVNVSARKLAVVEAYMGESFVGRDGENPNNTAGPIISTMYNKIVDVYYYSLVGQVYSDIMDLIICSDKNGHLSMDMTVLNIFLASSLKSGEMSSDKLSEILGCLKHMTVNSELNSSVIFDTGKYLTENVPEYTDIIENALNIVRARENNSSFSGTLSEDILIGGSGDEILNSSNGNDILDGGTGNDILNGGTGTDRYIYRIGDGSDTISDNETDEKARNIIEFAEGITLADLYIYRSGYNELTIQAGENEEDKITILNFVNNENSRKFKLKFADESEADLIELAKTLVGTEADETLHSIYQTENTLSGLGGNDTLNSGKGNDILIGGAGNDNLNGGTGSDTYIYGIGDGTDLICDREAGEEARNIIEFKKGITLDDLYIYRSGSYNLTIQVGENEEDKITITNGAYYEDFRKFRLKFADESEAELIELAKTLVGTEADETLNAIYQTENTLSGLGGNDTLNAGKGNDTLIGGAGNDKLYAGAGDDTLDGGTGNDTLYGGTGTDRYIYGIGDGTDIIEDSEADTQAGNIIEFKEGITLDDLYIYRTSTYNL